MLFKSISQGAIKDVDLSKRTITGYANTFNFKDSDGDITQPGAFSKTIQENGPGGKNRIFHLWQHTTDQILGKPLTLTEDENGLLFESVLRTGKLADDVLQMYQEGILTEHSIGYRTIKARWDEEQLANLLVELKLYEFSTVTWGANEMSVLTGIKKNEKENIIKQRINKLAKALKDGSYSDETMTLLNIELKQLEQIFIDGLKQPEKADTRQEPEAPTTDFKAINEVMQNFLKTI